MVKEVAIVLTRLVAEPIGEPIQMDDVQPEMTTYRPLEADPSVLEFVALLEVQVAVASLGHNLSLQY